MTSNNSAIIHDLRRQLADAWLGVIARFELDESTPMPESVAEFDRIVAEGLNKDSSPSVMALGEEVSAAKGILMMIEQTLDHVNS